MVSELQRLVDNLGERLSRSVAIDDRNVRLLAYNAYEGEVDDARMNSIMRRELPQKLVDYLHDVGVFDKDGLFTVPERPELGVAVPRIGVPVRYDRTLLGFLWLLASDGPLTDDEADAVRQTAGRAAQVLQRDHLLDELRQARVREYMRDLLSGEAHLRIDAAQRLIEEEFLVAGPVTALVVTVPYDRGQPLSEKDRVALAIGLADGCRRLRPRTAIHLERADHGVVVVACSGRSAKREIDDLASAIQQRVCAATGYPPDECHVGIGERRPGLREAHESYGEARLAAGVGRVVRVLGTLVPYSRLGVYGLLAELPLDRLRRSIHPGVLRLLEKDAEDLVLTTTLEVFLDNACDVRRTAALLKLHRQSVHYRLRRIEEVAQVDLADGSHRLALHLGLKVAQLVELR